MAIAVKNEKRRAMCRRRHEFKNRVFALCDQVHETGYAVHRYLGPGHLEKVYENSLVNRLRK